MPVFYDMIFVLAMLCYPQRFIDERRAPYPATGPYPPRRTRSLFMWFFFRDHGSVLQIIIRFIHVQQ